MSITPIAALFADLDELDRHAERTELRIGSHVIGDGSPALVIAEKEGLLRGDRTQVVRGRMPEAPVTRAKKRTGIDSDTDLIEVTLANLSVADYYADWLLFRRGW